VRPTKGFTLHTTPFFALIFLNLFFFCFVAAPRPWDPFTVFFSDSSPALHPLSVYLCSRRDCFEHRLFPRAAQSTPCYSSHVPSFFFWRRTENFRVCFFPLSICPVICKPALPPSSRMWSFPAATLFPPFGACHHPHSLCPIIRILKVLHFLSCFFTHIDLPSFLFSCVCLPCKPPTD